MNHDPAGTAPSHLAILAREDPGTLQGVSVAAVPERRPAPRWRRAVIGAALAGSALGSWFLTTPAGPRSLRDLPSRERAALVDRTLANLRDVCRGGDRPREFCREQANLLLGLPECGEACRADARSELLADTAVR